MSKFGPRGEWLIAAVAVGGISIVVSSVHTEEGAKPSSHSTESSPSAAQLYSEATTSCSAAACHGGVRPGPLVHSRQIEFTIWQSMDPHARAAETLAIADGLAASIAKRLASDGRPPIPPDRDERCLSCHSSCTVRPAGGGAIWNDRGVGCEGCHGSGNSWVVEHYAWRKEVEDDEVRLKQRYEASGMTWLGDATSRARVCAGCHIGSPAEPTDERGNPCGPLRPARDVTHDMISAGHPRLSYDYAEFQRSLPRHWREDESGTNANIRDWAAGQVVRAEAELKLLKARAAPGSSWPELAVWQCFGCHRSLSSHLPQAAREAGVLAWSNAELANTVDVVGRMYGMPRQAADAKRHLSDLNATIKRPGVSAADVTKAAESALASLQPMPPPNTPPKDASAVLDWLRSSSQDGGTLDWESAAARVCALRSWIADRSSPSPAESTEMQMLMKRLQFPPGFAGPKGYVPLNPKDLSGNLGR